MKNIRNAKIADWLKKKKRLDDYNKAIEKAKQDRIDA